MNKTEFCEGYERLRCVYGSLPQLVPAAGREWYAVLKQFSAGDFNDAISAWIAEQKFKPVPSELARYCSRAQGRRLVEARVAAQRSGEPCPWCGGGGFVRQEFEPDGRDVYFPCRCASSPDPETGASVLTAATADPSWIFDEQAHAFRRRLEWVTGDDRSATAPADQQQTIQQFAAQVGRSF